MEPALPATGMVRDLNLDDALLTRRDWPLPNNDQPAQLLRELDGGLSNSSFLLQVGGEQLVLRLDAAPHQLDLDRNNETAVQANAAQAGITAELIYACPEQGIRVTRYIPGASCTPEQIKKRGFIESLARLLRRVHALDAPRAILNPAQQAAYYWAELEQHSDPGRLQFEHLRTPMNNLMNQAWKQMPANCCCHNDLVLENILHRRGRLYLLDWEYAALGNPYFDLAALVLNFKMNSRQARQLLLAYEGEGAGVEAERHLRSSQAIYLYLELLWYQQQGRVANDPQLLERARQRQLGLTQLLRKATP